ncbi:MAG: hypothetical protein IKX28_01690, partial [Bacteroidales bacterium]|nr:hypothetical protein [Bacteroidales bacterium]
LTEAMASINQLSKRLDQMVYKNEDRAAAASPASPPRAARTPTDLRRPSTPSSPPPRAAKQHTSPG